MDEVYDLHRHTHFIAFCIRKNIIDRSIHSTSTRYERSMGYLTQEDGSYITYDKQKSKILSWGRKCDNENEDAVQIDMSGERLCRLFKKGKDSWNADDLFFFKAVSDFLGLSVEKLMKEENEKGKQIKDTDALHYVFVVPSEWEEEIREALIRPIFVHANLISEKDNRNRILFCTDVESTYYFITQYQYLYDLNLTRNTIICRTAIVEESKVLMDLYLIFIGYPLFNFSNSLSFPKLMASDSLLLTTNDVKNGIREFIKIKFSFDAQEETIKNIMEELSNYIVQADEDKASYLEMLFITDKSISELDKKQEALIKSIRPIDICAEISKRLPNNLKNLLKNGIIKEHSLLKLNPKRWLRKIDNGLLDWSEYLLEYNRISFSSNYIIPKRLEIAEFCDINVSEGAVRYLFDALQNSDLYSKPRILSTEYSAISSSIFLNSKPDAVLNIDISLESTMLSFSLLDENGLIKEIWNEDYFIPLRSLGSFFIFSEVTTLNVKSSFITFVKEYLTDETNIFLDELNGDIENILKFESRDKDLMVSTQQQRLFGTEDSLRDVVYASNLVRKDDGSKKLRIAIRGEELFPVIQQSFNLQFPLKTFFVVTQLCEDYVQLTLNQVVTESGLENKYQEAIIIRDETIPILNIYDTLGFNMWRNITENSSLIQLCDTHKGHDDNKLSEIFSLENQAELTNNLKEHISKNILNKTLNEQNTDTATISLSTSCNCRVCLTLGDITEISFRPVLQDIISLVFTSLVNKQRFGKYRNLQYIFHLIRFNYNPQFQHILKKILKDETDDFLYEEGIDVDHYTLLKLSNQLLQPVLRQEPSSYKAFQVGVLYHVYSENYGFSVDATGNNVSRYLKTSLRRLKKTDTLKFDETVHAEDKLESIDGPSCSGFTYKKGHYTSFIISILYKGHSPSLSLALKMVGGEIQKIGCATLAEPMTLARF
ncbi:hypothetical protein MFLAVUS_000876 [Mucor flavus]|uniref:Uncharacterized protein n=1 Tax=Mucor flavus TaxID=439312 RepID=A0ABP9YKY2_9FUNG